MLLHDVSDAPPLEESHLPFIAPSRARLRPARQLSPLVSSPLPPLPSTPLPSTPPEAPATPSALLESAEELVTEALRLLEPLVHGDPAAQEELLAAVEHAERLTAKAVAAQKRASVAFRSSRIAQEIEMGVPARQRGRGVRNEIGLARRVSGARAGNQLSLDRVLVESLPRTFGLLAEGLIGEWTADEVAKAVLVLDDEDREEVDASIAEQLPLVTPRRAGALARARAQELDVKAALARHEREVAERTVTIRPVADGMVRLSALLPTPDGVAVYAALEKTASSARAAGQHGSRGNHRADALVRLVTGLEDAVQADVEIQLLMTDAALLDSAADAAWLEGAPIPAAVARRFALGEARRGPKETESGRRFIRRLYTDPISGTLRAADATRRRFSAADRRFLQIADQYCRMPWCGAKIRHFDHVERYADGGRTERGNGTGLCESCNYTEELPGWSARIVAAPSSVSPQRPPGTSRLPGARRSGSLRELEVTTPLGKTYRSEAPRLRRRQ